MCIVCCCDFEDAVLESADFNGCGLEHVNLVGAAGMDSCDWTQTTRQIHVIR